MENIERLLVHVEEAYRMAVVRDPAHLRLSLMLFDSAAELILHRAAKDRLHWQKYPRQSLEGLRRLEAQQGHLPDALSEMKAKLEEEVLSRATLQRIDRVFGAKVEYLVASAGLPASLAAVLDKLHRYRNEAYHQDRVRESTIETAVHIYSFVVCELMRWARIPGYLLLDPPPPTVAKYVEDGFDGFEVLSRAADRLEREFGFNNAPIAGYLAEHLTSRLDEIADDLEYAARLHGDPDFDVEAVLHRIQIDDAPWATAAELRAHAVPFTMTRLHRCRERATELSSLNDPLDAFREFAEIEDEFEDVEAELSDLMSAIDDGIQAEIDRARGK